MKDVSRINLKLHNLPYGIFWHFISQYFCFLPFFGNLLSSTLSNPCLFFVILCKCHLLCDDKRWPQACILLLKLHSIWNFLSSFFSVSKLSTDNQVLFSSINLKGSAKHKEHNCPDLSFVVLFPSCFVPINHDWATWKPGAWNSLLISQLGNSDGWAITCGCWTLL